MTKKIIVGLFAIFFIFVVNNHTLSAQTVVANLGDVRIYRYSDGTFGVESDIVKQCLPLKFRNIDGWLVQVACSSVVIEFASNRIGDGVANVVQKAFAPFVSPVYSYVAGQIASKVASWASGKSLDYLCGK